MKKGIYDVEKGKSGNTPHSGFFEPKAKSKAIAKKKKITPEYMKEYAEKHKVSSSQNCGVCGNPAHSTKHHLTNK